MSKFTLSTVLAAWILSLSTSWAEVMPSPAVQEAEQQRIETMDSASQATIAIFSPQGQGGGSGVVISPNGFALSNFHVTSACGTAMKCGMANGQVYDAVIVGIDPVGDVALIQLLGRDDFPTAPLGDSDTLEVGDWVFVAGNPFLLADDFTPSVSYGIVSGIQRYQYPAGTLLEYADCIQTDAAINPGNSGGPLFNADGELVGINGRGSFEKRGRVNVGVGYAISINQIKRFLTHLKSGRIVDHAGFGATVATQEDGRVTVNDILESSAVFRRGLRYGDQVLRFADREILNANRLKNALGVYPAGWTVPVTYQREGEIMDTWTRLPSLHDSSQLFDMLQKQASSPPVPPDDKRPKEEKQPKPGGLRPPPAFNRAPQLPPAIADRYESRRGYANYWYNLQKQEELWSRYASNSGFTESGYAWHVQGDVVGGSRFDLQTSMKTSSWRSAQGEFKAQFEKDLESQLSPPGSGGLLLTLHLWQRMLQEGMRQFGEVYYYGQLPSGPDLEMVDCLVGIYGGVEIHFCFSLTDGELIALQMFPGESSDPCRLEFSDFGDVSGRRVPRRWTVLFGDQPPLEYVVDQWEIVDE